MSSSYQCREPLADGLLLAFQEYSKAIDIWSIGCILAEMSEWKGHIRELD